MPSKNGRQPRRPGGSVSPPPSPRLATRTIAVTSGKGGVGKTSVVVNLAVALAREGARVSLLDADYGLGNVDIFLGLETDRTLEHLLGGSHRLEDVLLDGPEGVRILPASTGVQQLTRLSRAQSSRLRSAVADLSAASDVLLVDTASGISDNVVSWLQAANDVLVVTSPDPAAIIDAYAVLKLLAGLDHRRRLLLLVNQVRDEQEAVAVHQRLESAVFEFLHADLVAFGHVVRDPLLQEAVRRRQPVVTFLPDSPSSACFTQLARRLLAEAPGTNCSAPRSEPAESATATK